MHPSKHTRDAVREPHDRCPSAGRLPGGAPLPAAPAPPGQHPDSRSRQRSTTNLCFFGRAKRIPFDVYKCCVGQTSLPPKESNHTRDTYSHISSQAHVHFLNERGGVQSQRGSHHRTTRHQHTVQNYSLKTYSQNPL